MNSVIPDGITHTRGSAMIGSSTSQTEACRPASEVEREANRMNESMGMLDKMLEELRDRLRPMLIPESPEGKHPAACGETAPGSEVGQLLRNTADHASSMRRQIDGIISRLAL